MLWILIYVSKLGCIEFNLAR